jgi:hypothetical protein
VKIRERNSKKHIHVDELDGLALELSSRVQVGEYERVGYVLEVDISAEGLLAQSLQSIQSIL